MYKYIIFILFIFFSVKSICSDTHKFYISSEGNDQNTGTSGTPFLSINGSLKKIKSLRSSGQIRGNVKLILREGKYHLNEPISITNNDWDGADTLFIEGEGKTIITGGIELQKKIKVSNNLWAIEIFNIPDLEKYNIQQLFINGKRSTKARTPNLGEILFKTKNTKQVPLENSKNVVHHVSLTDDQLSSLIDAKKDLGNIIVSFNHKWVNTKGYVSNIYPENKTFTFTSPFIDPIISLSAASQFYFENSISFLDSPGEWFLDSNNIIYYFPYKEMDISSVLIEIPILGSLLNIKGSENELIKNIQFKNITFQQTKYSTPKTGRTSPQAGNYNGASINVNFAQNIVFSSCEIKNIGDYGVWIKEGNKNCRIENCYIHDLGSGGIKIGDYNTPKKNNSTANIIIDNNIIHSGGYEIPTGVGILVMHSGNNIISHNDIADFRYSGISVGWTWGYRPSLAINNKIIYNHIHHLGWGELSDLGGIYTLGPSEGSEIKNNVIHDIYSYDFRGWGIYLDEGSSNILIENNLVYNCKSAGFHQHYGKENIVRNNIFANQINSQLEVTRVEKHISFYFTKNIVYYNSGIFSNRPEWRNANFLSDNNLYWDASINSALFYNNTLKDWSQKTGKDKNSIVADPLFVSPNQNNFNFKNKRNIDKIKFIPFDYTQAGIHEKNKWKEKAILDPYIINTYNTSIERRKKEERLKK